MKDAVSLDETITLLNEILELDRYAVQKLLDTRVQCNLSLADHPAVQVRSDKEVFSVGLLGILNGLFGTIESGPKKGYGQITAMIEADGTLIKFIRTPLGPPVDL